MVTSRWLTGALALAGLILTSGCGPRPVTGGTPGALNVNGQPLAEVQITVHRLDETTPQMVGFAVSDPTGRFALVQPQAKGPLRLPRGRYGFTLESAGAPIRIPKEYERPDTTPLKLEWTGSDPQLVLEMATP